jgi:GDP-L-fucose synthase
MKVLITGGNGMVGRNLLEHPSGFEFEIFSPGRHKLDLLTQQSIEAYLDRNRPDVIVHAAGKVGGIKANIADQAGFFHQNLTMGANLLLAARKMGVGRVINLGSTCMYPREALNPLIEDSILSGKLEPTNEGYALAKIGVQRLGGYLSENPQDFCVKTIIPCNLYGRHDKFDEVNAHLIPAILRKLHLAKVNGDNTVVIWGDGTARREFMYAQDLAGLIWEACKRFEELPDLMNAGFGRDYSVAEYYMTARKIVGFDGSFTYDPSQPTGMQQKLASSILAEEWGWQADTHLEDGLKETYEYFKEINK